jgi:MFS family permease
MLCRRSSKLLFYDGYHSYTFILTSITAPLLGVFIGGWFIDRQGGYHGVENVYRALKLCTVLAMCAACFAFPCTFFNDLIPVVICLWFLLFFGGNFSYSFVCDRLLLMLPPTVAVAYTQVPFYLQQQV